MDCNPQTSATVAVAVGLKSSATAVDLWPSVQHWIYNFALTVNSTGEHSLISTVLRYFENE